MLSANALKLYLFTGLAFPCIWLSFYNELMFLVGSNLFHQALEVSVFNVS